MCVGSPSLAYRFQLGDNDLLLTMPTSITKYVTFDGGEFLNEEEAKEHEIRIKQQGVELRNDFFSELEDHLPKTAYESKLLDLIRSYSDDEAWKIMKSLKSFSIWFEHTSSELADSNWLFYESGLM